MSAVTYATAQILRALPRARIGRAVGHLAERRWSHSVGKAVVGLYSRVYRVRLDECAEERDWPSFDAFFTRRLREGARPVASDRYTVASPADGTIEAAGTIDNGGTFVVKGRPYSVAELVGGDREAERFRGGAGFVVYLSPKDYHRVHTPAAGVIRRIRSVPGDYYPVNGIGMRHIPRLFCRNRRVVIEIDGEAGLGRIAVVMVVAMIVGRITTIGIDHPDVPFGDHCFDPPLRVGPGDEIGVFHLGSTAVVLTESRAAGQWVVRGGAVRYGDAVLRAERDFATLGRPDGAPRSTTPPPSELTTPPLADVPADALSGRNSVEGERG
jgi:phosphatidylserine decarboxylase